MTTAALAKILDVVNEEGVAPLSEWQINDFIRKEFARVRIDLAVPAIDGSVLTWTVADLGKLLVFLSSECSTFRDGMREAIHSAGTEPLRATIYFDEVTPGNLLRPDNARKVWSIYVSMQEFGRHRLAREEWWLPLGVLRSGLAAKAQGGVSGCIRQLLRSIILPPAALSTVGVTLLLPAPTLARVSVSTVLGDEAALKSLWSVKGASGVRFCMFCANIVSKASELAAREPRLIDASCSDPARFQRTTDQDIWQAFDRLSLEQGRMRKGEFEILERALGAKSQEQVELTNMTGERGCRWRLQVSARPF